jgi:copper(I)-binding protein
MLMGLTREVADGDVIMLTLVFEKAGEVVIEAPVDNARKTGMEMDHSGHQMQHGQTEGSD